MNLSIFELNIGNIVFIVIVPLYIFLMFKPEVGMKRLMKGMENYKETFGTGKTLTRRYISFFYYVTGVTEDGSITRSGIIKFRKLLLFCICFLYLVTRFH